MKICVLVHSTTGNTLKFAKLLDQRMKDQGHDVDLFELQTNEPVKNGTLHQPMNFRIMNTPDISEYDAIVAGGPVWAFSISTVIYKCLSSYADLKGKKFVPFVTMGFPSPGMGGKQAIGTLSKIATEKGAEVLSGAVACKMFHNIGDMMEKEAERIAKILK